MSRVVKVGDRDYTVEPFNGRKAILAGRMVARIAKKAPGILQADAEFQRGYAEANALRITRDMALTTWRDRLPEISAEDWDKVNGVLVIPQPPDLETRIAAGFTEAFETAEEEVLKLLALCVMPNGDLKDAAQSGDPRQALLAKADELMDGGTLGELVELAVAAGEQLKAELAGESLGKLKALWARPGRQPDTTSETTSPDTAESSDMTTPPPSQPEPTMTPTLPEMLREPTSSTASPPPTDGAQDESSTAPRGGSLSPSVPA